MELVSGIDFSFDTSKYSLVTAQHMKADGLLVAWPGSWHGNAKNSHVNYALRNAYDAHQVIGTYVVIHGSYPPDEAIKRGLEACGDMVDKLNFVAIDVEMHLSENAVTATNLIDKAIQEVLRRNLRPAIYTAYWAWTQFAHNTQAFKQVPLIYAQYNGNNNVHKPAPTYGGWDFPYIVGHQYTNTTNYNGINVDFNAFDKQWIMEWIMEGEEDMSTEEVIAAINKLGKELKDGQQILHQGLFTERSEAVLAGNLLAAAELVQAGTEVPSQIRTAIKNWLNSQ